MVDKIPKEILIEIFDKLPTSDLITLTLVCNSFNVLINNSKLSEKFILNLDPESENRKPWVGSRKYTKTCITTSAGILSTLNYVAADIKKISFKLLSIDLKSVAEILILCPKLKEIEFEDVKTDTWLNLGNCDLPQHDNIELWISNTSPDTMDIFKHVKIVKLTIIGPKGLNNFGMCWNDNDCRIGFAAFLKSQTKLVDFTLKNFKQSTNIFTDNKLDNVPFRLQKLTLSNFYIQNKSFFKFLSNHINTLEYAEIKSIEWSEEMSALISQCKNLKKFSFSGSFIPYHPFPSIEILKIDLEDDLMWATQFPNVIELNISSNLYKNFQHFHLLPKLKKLKISNSYFYVGQADVLNGKQLAIPGVTCDETSIFKPSCTYIEELYLENTPMDWLPEYLHDFKVNLQLLTLSDLRISKRDRYFLNIYSFKIKMLRELNCIQGDV